MGLALIPSLCSIEAQTRSLRAPSEPSGVDQELGRDEQRNALDAGRGVGKARQHEMDDVFGDVIFAPGDEDLVAGDAIGVALGNRACAHGGEIGAGLRFGQVHGAGPGSGDHLGQIDRLERVRAVMVDGGNGAGGQHLAQRKRQVGGFPHFLHGSGDQRRQALSAKFERRRHGVPAVFAEGGESLFYTRRGRHHAVLADAARLVAGMVERREHVAGEFAGFFKNGLDQIVGNLVIARQGGDVSEVSDFPHGEKHIADGRLIGGHDGLR